MVLDSLIQRRHALNRARLHGVLATGFGGLGLLATAFLLGSTSALVWTQAVLYGGWLLIGIVSLRRYRRDRDAFEAEHGIGAGRQEPVR